MHLRIGDQFGLPPTISIPELLGQKEEIGRLRVSHELLQIKLERAEVDAEEHQAAFKEVEEAYNK